MNRKIKAYHAITCIILFYLAAACLVLGPGGVLKKERVAAGNENPVGTAAVKLEQQVQQVFIAEGSYLKYMELYLADDDAGWNSYHLRFYNDENELLIDRDFVVSGKEEFPGFFRIPLSVETEPGRVYFWQLQGLEGSSSLNLAYEDTAQSGMLGMGYYYSLENGESVMHEGQNIVMRLGYVDSPSFREMAALYAVLILIALALIAAVEYAGRRGKRLKGSVPLSRVAALTLEPTLIVCVCYLGYAVYVQNRFGGELADKIVYGLGIGIAAVFFSLVILGKRRKKSTQTLRELVRGHGMDWLQTAAFAGVLWGCIHYMNALYQLQQNIAYREVLVWSGLVLVTMCGAKELFNRKSAVWLAVSGTMGAFFYLFQKNTMEEEQTALELELLRDDILIVVVFGLVMLVLAGKFYAFHKSCKRDGCSLLCRVRKRVGGMNRFYAALLAAFLILLVAFRNTRLWPVYLVVVFALFYLFYLSWKGRERLLANFGNGVMLNFALACMFAFARRPYRAWIYNRYNFVFHTVTITATYLTLVVCVMTVRLLMQRKEGKRLREMWGTLLLYGFSMSFLFFTFSRTGYLAVIVMTVLMVPFVTFFCYRQGPCAFLKYVLCMGVTVLLCLPVVYTGVRILPALYNDPYIFEVEDISTAIRKDDPENSRKYMTISTFKDVMRDKLFSDASVDGEDLEELMLCMTQALRGEHILSGTDLIYVKPQTVLVASAADLDAGEDFSNGRMEIFRCYIEEWNLTGHDEMGVSLPNGSVSVHAHNTYLQVIHDHGLITGILYLLLGLVSACLMFAFAMKKNRENPWAALPLAVFIGFAVASLVEWLYHPCNPMGFSVMVVFAPLLQFSPGKKGSGK